jgi:hypothetical protein
MSGRSTRLIAPPNKQSTKRDRLYPIGVYQPRPPDSIDRIR